MQARAVQTRARIADGALLVLAREGVQGLTHRAVARAAGVSLAATTYHFDAKADIIEEASRTLLDGYLAAFRRMAGRIASGEDRRFSTLDELVARIVLNALGRDRTRSLAWCELILHGGRSAGGRTLAREWYEQLDAIWQEIARLIEPGADAHKASAAIDMTVGLTFILHPLGFDQDRVRGILSGKVDPEPLLDRIARSRRARPEETDGEFPRRYAETRQKIVAAAIGIIVDEGAAGLSHRRVAEASGMVRSGPSYYFATIDELLETAQAALFERAKARYRAGLGTWIATELQATQLLDLTTAIFFREALEFGRENIGHYSVWMSAAQNASLRPAVAGSLLELHRAWVRRIAAVAPDAPAARLAVRMQAMFIGKLIRTIASAANVADLSRVREDFASVLRD